MRFLASLLFIVVMSVLCFICIKISYWIEKVDKKSDKNTFGFETDDYETNRKIRTASIIIFFIFATVGLLIFFLNQ